MGEATQIRSGGKLRATPHCVRGAMGSEAVGISRNTFAVFMQPHWDEKLDPPAGKDYFFFSDLVILLFFVCVFI